jgi:hypothetical protein
MVSRRIVIGLWLFALAGCATGAPLGQRGWLAEATVGPYAPAAQTHEIPGATEPIAPQRAALVRPGAREAAVQAARALVGKQRIALGGRRFGDDCTGLVRAVYSQVGLELMGEGEAGDNGVTAIWRYAQRHGRTYSGGRPVPGDLVFFRETYDLNRDGHDNDGLTHIGVVDTVGDDETVVVIHRVARGVVRYRMNLKHPDVAVDAQGHALNDWLRAPVGAAPPRLTAQLFAGYATLLPVEPRLAGR